MPVPEIGINICPLAADNGFCRTNVIIVQDVPARQTDRHGLQRKTLQQGAMEVVHMIVSSIRPRTIKRLRMTRPGQRTYPLSQDG